MKKGAKKVIKTLAATSAITAAAGYLTFYQMMGRHAYLYPKISSVIGKKMKKVETHDENDERLLWLKEQKPQKFEMINIKNQRLKASFIPAEKPTNIYVFCAHGYRNYGLNEFRYILKFYHDIGYNIFVVDHQAHGESDGKYIGFGYHEYQDSLAWLRYMLEKFGNDIQIILHGISMGSATVMMMTGDESLPKNVKFTVADCGYTSAKEQFEHMYDNLMHFPKFPFLNSANAFNKAINKYSFEDANPLRSVQNAKIPMLFIHGDSDGFVPTEMVYRLYDACASKDKDLLVVKDAAHAESYKRDPESYQEKILEYSGKFLDKN